MGYYRGIPTGPHDKRARIERIASEMRERYLREGSGCKSRLRAILARTGNREPVVDQVELEVMWGRGPNEA